MQLTGEPIDAHEALRIGLVNQVVSPEELIPTAEAMANLIAMNGPLGVRSAKEAMLRGLGKALEDALRFENLLFSTLTRTEDFKEGPRAFAEKRLPEWHGRWQRTAVPERRSGDLYYKGYRCIPSERTSQDRSPTG